MQPAMQRAHSIQTRTVYEPQPASLLLWYATACLQFFHGCLG